MEVLQEKFVDESFETFEQEIMENPKRNNWKILGEISGKNLVGTTGEIFG